MHFHQTLLARTFLAMCHLDVIRAADCDRESLYTRFSENRGAPSHRQKATMPGRGASRLIHKRIFSHFRAFTGRRGGWRQP
jgi:hypothetical protein